MASFSEIRITFFEAVWTKLSIFFHLVDSNVWFTVQCESLLNTELCENHCWPAFIDEKVCCWTMKQAHPCFLKCCLFQVRCVSCRNADLPLGVSWWNMQGLLVCLLNPTHVTVSELEWQPAETNHLIHVVSVCVQIHFKAEQKARDSSSVKITLVSPPWGVHSWLCIPSVRVQC